MKKKILILGAGNAQIDLIDYCKELGLEVHGLSYTNTDSGISHLDYFEQINIVDVDAVKEYYLRNKIDVIYSVGSDIAVPTINKVAESVDCFHFVSSETADICCNKNLMRMAIGSKCKYNVPYYCCSSIEECRNINFYPLMLKPVDSQGQRGVFRINNIDELVERFDESISYSKSKKVILEKYIDGYEVSVNAYVKNGDVIFSIISDRESFNQYPGGIIKAHHLPSIFHNTIVEQDINKLVAEVADVLNIKNGPLYFQIKVCDGKPYVIEVTPRLDGCHMWKLIKSYCGVNLMEMTVSHLLNNQLPEIAYKPSDVYYHTEFFCEPPETEFNESKYSDCFFETSKLYYNTGEKVKRMNGYMEKCGYRIFKSPYKVGIIGGSGMIGSMFSELYGNKYDIVNISRVAGNTTDYSSNEIKTALDGCDSVVICAAKKVNAHEKQSLSIYDVNNHILENTLVACLKLGIKNIVFLSSRCVYSLEQVSPVSEDGTIEPINYYGISKRTNELLCQYYNKKYFTNIKILRVSQVIGEEKNGYFLSSMLEKVRNGENVDIYSGIKRDYIYVKDVCGAIDAALLHYAQSGIFNIGSGKPTSLVDLSEKAIQAAGSFSKINAIVKSNADCSEFYLDTNRAKEMLDFSCSYTLTDIFNDMIKGEAKNE